MKSNLSSADIALLSKELFEDVCEVLNDGTELHGIDYSDGRALHTIWDASRRIGQDFDKQRDAFLWIVERLLVHGRIKLHKDGVLLEDSVEEQVNTLRRSFPADEAASGYEDFYWWFFDDECPAGVAWRARDGTFQIAE